ncbi:MAG: hypothetical protein AB1668_07505, partial [Nanoarchaeota archaeon]
GKIIWVSGTIYKCELEKGTDFPIWAQQPGFDKDHDGYTDKAGDCADDPKASGFEDPQNCPELDLETGEIDCKYPQHSKCAICINPGAPEVCGDKVNNDCGGSEDADEMEEVNELEGETSDDCNKNQYSCEMTEVPLPSEETKPGICVGGKNDGKECSSDEDCPPKPNADESEENLLF